MWIANLGRMATPPSRAPDELANLAQQLVAARDAQEVAIDAFFEKTRRARPPFDHLRDFWTNFADGPRVDGVGPLAERTPRIATRLLGYELNSPFGVPACALTPQARFIKYFAERGFDLITYKTVRDRAWNPHPFPQWGFAPDETSSMRLSELGDGAVQRPIFTTLDPTHVASVEQSSLVNSFGVPSLPVEQWKADISAAKAVLRFGQVMIVSVMGSPDAPDTKTMGDLVRQFASTAANAVEAGADVIELNLSCPNTGSGDLICADPELSAMVTKAVRREIRSSGIPLLIKTSYLPGTGLEDLVLRCQKDIDGVVAINTVLVPAIGADGRAFFPKRPKAGISGNAIFEFGLDAVRRLERLRQESRADSDWVIVAVGGVTSVARYAAYIDEGADAVQSCSGAWLNPGLAAEIRAQFGHAPSSKLSASLPSRDARPRATSLRRVLLAVLETLASGGVNVLRGKQ